MNHKQQLSHLALPQRGVIFSRILLLGVAAAATSVVTMVAPRPARAEAVSPVSPTVVNPTSPGTPSIGGTSLSETTTTETTTTGQTTTTTTTGQTTTTTTTTTTNTTTTTGTQNVGVEATTQQPEPVAPEVTPATTAATTTAAPTTAATTTAAPTTAAPTTAATTTAATTTPTTAPTQGTATTQQQAPQPQPAVTTTATTTVVEQFVVGTTIETVYVRGLAGRLGTSQAVLVQTRVFQVVTGLSGNQTAVLQAFQAALERAGILNLASFNNAAFADLIANSGNAELAIEVFSRLAVNRLMLLSRLGGLSSLSTRRGLVGVRFARITITQYVVYQGLGVRFNGFPRERKK